MSDRWLCLVNGWTLGVCACGLTNNPPPFSAFIYFVCILMAVMSFLSGEK